MAERHSKEVLTPNISSLLGDMHPSQYARRILQRFKARLVHLLMEVVEATVICGN